MMTPHRQLIKHDPASGHYGDCHRTCVAAILDLQPAEVPHFYNGPDNGDGAHAISCREWLSRHGFGYFVIPVTGGDGAWGLEQVLTLSREQSPATPFILGGRSALGCNHSVVVMDGEIVCDPSGNGIVGPCDDGLWWLEAISVGPAWQARGISVP